jgi:hypothetical protein
MDAVSQIVTSVIESSASVVVAAAVLGAARALWRHQQDHEDTRAHLTAQDERLDRIESEFYPNGGESSRDLQEDLMAALIAMAREQGIRLPPRRSRPKGHR